MNVPRMSPARRHLTVVVLQPSYLPWLGFFDQMRRADVFVYYDDVQFDKHGWRNRNRIKAPTGPHWLTVPVRHHNLERPRILDIEIDNRQPWARKHTQSIRQFYARAPYLKCYVPELEELLHRRWDRLVDLNLALTQLLGTRLGLAAQIVRSSELGIAGERTERLLRICQHFEATHYLSGQAAQSYLDVTRFEQHGIAVEWQDYQHPEYPQQHGAFVSHLSAIDLLLNCGETSSAVAYG